MSTEAKPLVQLTLNSEEKIVLLNLIHLAIKAEGLNVAANGVVLAQKINNAPVVETPVKE